MIDPWICRVPSGCMRGSWEYEMYSASKCWTILMLWESWAIPIWMVVMAGLRMAAPVSWTVHPCLYSLFDFPVNGFQGGVSVSLFDTVVEA